MVFGGDSSPPRRQRSSEKRREVVRVNVLLKETGMKRWWVRPVGPHKRKRGRPPVVLARRQVLVTTVRITSQNSGEVDGFSVDRGMGGVG